MPSLSSVASTAAAQARKLQAVLSVRRLRFCAQTSATECGAACLTMLLNYHNVRADLSSVVEQCIIGRHGESAADLARVASRFGCCLRAYACDVKRLRTFTAPVMLHWGFNHWVILNRYRRGKALILDPAVGLRIADHATVDRKFTGIVLILRPTEGVSQPSALGRMTPIWHSLNNRIQRRLWYVAAAALTLTLFAQALNIGVAFGFGILLNTVLPSHSLTLMDCFAALMIALVLAKAVCSYIRSVLLTYVRSRLDGVLLPAIVEHLLHLPVAFFTTRGSGDVSSRVDNYNALRQLLSETTITSFIDGIMMMLYMIALGAIAPFAVPYVLLASSAYLLMILVRSSVEKHKIAMEMEAEVEQRQVLLETLRGIRYIKASGREASALRAWTRKFRRQLSISTDKSYCASIWDSLSDTCASIGPLLAVLVSATRMRDGVALSGELVTTLVLSSSIFVPIAGLVRAGHNFQYARAYAQRLTSILLKPREPYGDGHLTIEREVALCDVRYAYPGEARAAVRSISCRFLRDQTTVVMGASGAGKSTLINLLLGLLRPDAGRITCDGRELEPGNMGTFRRLIGVVVQQDTVYGGSIRANIALGRPEATLKDIMDAARLAELHDDILQMPAGYETHLAEDGSNISGGQRQRIALARALLGKPALLVLDEATSQLDAETEGRILSNLASAPCTKIIISHRPAALRIAHQVLVLDGGEITMSGTPEQILRGSEESIDGHPRLRPQLAS